MAVSGSNQGGTTKRVKPSSLGRGGEGFCLFCRLLKSLPVNHSTPYAGADPGGKVPVRSHVIEASGSSEAWKDC